MFGFPSLLVQVSCLLILPLAYQPPIPPARPPPAAAACGLSEPGQAVAFPSPLPHLTPPPTAAASVSLRQVKQLHFPFTPLQRPAVSLSQVKQ